MKDYLLLLDGNEKLKRIINAYEFYDDELKSTTTGERVLTFKMNDSVVDIENGNKIGVFIEGKFDLFIVDQVEAETYYSTSIKVTCLHDFYSIQTQKAITQYYKESVSVHDAMTEMLKGTSYELGECVERTLISIGPYLFKNPLWCIQDIISNFGVEINYSIELNETRTGIARKLVHVVNALGSDTGIRCSTDLNVSKIKRIEKDKFYTVMYGCGAEYQKDLVKYKYDFKDISWSASNGNPTDKPAGQEFVEDKKAIAKYGRIIGIFEDGRIKDPELLLKKTWEALQKNNRPIVSYELDIEELKTEDGYEHLNFKLGDIIILQNTIDNSRAKFRIVEDCVSVRNKNKRKVTVGEQIKGIFSGGNSGNSDGTEGPGGSVIDPGGEEIKPPSLEEITPDTLPAVPIVTAKGLWGKVMLSWTYENKMYYNYEVYASRIKDFEPIVFNMIYSGKASAFLHEAGANETWYYRVRAVNSFGNSTQFSEQVEATTTKLADGTEYFESAAIKDALIEELRLDRGWIGQLDATYLKVKGKFTVVDGNNTETMKVDSFGHITLKPSVFKILIDGKEENVITQSKFDMSNEQILMKVTSTGKANELENSMFSEQRIWDITNPSKVWYETADWYGGGVDFTTSIRFTDCTNTGAHVRQRVYPKNPKMARFSISGYAHYFNVKNTEGSGYPMCHWYVEIRYKDGSSGYHNFDIRDHLGHDQWGLLQWNINTEVVSKNSPIDHINFYVYKRNTTGDLRTTKLYLHEGHDKLDWRPAGEIYNNSVIVDGEGLSVKHDNGCKSVMSPKEFAFYDLYTKKTLSIDNGGMAFRSIVDGQEIGFAKTSQLNNDNSKVGFTLAPLANGTYVALGLSNSPNSVGFNADTAIIVTKGHGGYERGTHFSTFPVHTWQPFTIHNNAQVLNGSSLFFGDPNNGTMGVIFQNSSESMAIGAGNKLLLGVNTGGASVRHGISMVKASGEVNKVYIDSWSNWNFQNFTMWNMKIGNTLQAQSFALKSRIKEINDTFATMSMTDGEIRYTCRQEEIITSDDKKLIVEIPQIMSENMELDYHINISKMSWGDYRIVEKTPYYFEIETNVDNFRFTFEVVGKLIDKPDPYFSKASEQYINMGNDESAELKTIRTI